MSTQFIQKFSYLRDIPNNPFHAGIGMVGDALYARVAGTIVPITADLPGEVYYVDTNVTASGDEGKSWDDSFKTMDEAFDVLAQGDTIHWRGNVNEQLTTPLGTPNVTLIAAGTRPRHADTHPLNGELSGATWKIGSLGNLPLLIIRTPGWRILGGLFAAHASNYAIRLDRNAVEDATEEDASHLEVGGVRFASGAGGISDTGGCFNVAIEDCWFAALTTACLLGVGNIGVGQLMWHIRRNHFNNFTNGVKIAAHECIIEDNKFTDGGTPNSTYVLNTNNGGGRDNFVVNNYFQTANANYGEPDLVGCSTDLWRNQLIDATDKSGAPT